MSRQSHVVRTSQSAGLGVPRGVATGGADVHCEYEQLFEWGDVQSRYMGLTLDVPRSYQRLFVTFSAYLIRCYAESPDYQQHEGVLDVVVRHNDYGFTSGYARGHDANFVLMGIADVPAGRTEITVQFHPWVWVEPGGWLYNTVVCPALQVIPAQFVDTPDCVYGKPSCW